MKSVGGVGTWSTFCDTWPYLLSVFNILDSSLMSALMRLDILHRLPYSNPMVVPQFSYVPISRMFGLLAGAMLCFGNDSGIHGVQAREVVYVLDFLDLQSPFSIFFSCMPSSFLNSPANVITLPLPVSPDLQRLAVCLALFSLSSMTIPSQRMGCRRGSIRGRPLC